MLKIATFWVKKGLPFLYLQKFISNCYLLFCSKLILLKRVNPDTRIIKESQEYRQIQRQSHFEAFRQGTKGALQDLKIYTSDWGFKLGNIKTKTFLWHGMLDQTFWMGKYVASRIKNCRPTYFPDAGHILIATKGKQILSKL